MKPFRVLLVSLGILALFGVVAIALALTPAVQRWAVLRATRDVPELKFELAHVSAGFSGVTMNGVKAEHRGIPIEIERLEAKFPVLGFLWGSHLELSQLQVAGLRIDASGVSGGKAEAAAAGAPAAAPGLLAQLELPFDLTLDDVRIEGRALLPAAPAQPPVEAAYTITGGKFAPGREGTLQLDATLRNSTEGAKVSTLRTQAVLRATPTPQRRFNTISLTTLVDAEGPALAGPSQLKVGAELYHTSVGENYEITIGTLLQGQAENVLIVRAQLPTGTRRYAGEWALKVRTAQLEPFFLGGVMPDFDATGDGRFAFDTTSANSDLEGLLQGKVSRLEVIEPAWRAFGSLQIETIFDLGQQGGVLDVRRFKASVAGNKPVLEIRSTAPIRYDLGKKELLAGNGLSDALLRLDLQGLPIDWIRPFLSGADLSGGELTGQMDLVRTSTNAAEAAIRGRLQLDELNIVQEGRPLVTKAAVTARIEAALAGGTVNAPVLELAVNTPTGDAFDLKGRFSLHPGPDAPLSVAGRFSAATEKLFAPWLPGAPVSALGEFDVTLRDGVIEIQPGHIELKQGTGRALVEATIAQPITLNLDSHAAVARDPLLPVGRISLGRVPLAALPIAQPDAMIGGYVQQGDFELTAPAGRITLRAVTPLRLSDVSLMQGRQAALTNLSLEANPIAEYAGPGTLRVQSGEVIIRAAQAALMSLNFETTQAPDQDTQTIANFTLEVPALATQPLFAGTQAVSAGRASGEFRATTGVHSQLEARVTLNGLVQAETGQSLPVANVGFRSRVQSNGAVAVQVPILLDDAGRRSDLNFALELSPLGRGYSVDGRVTGQQVELEDLLGVLAVFSSSAATGDADRQPVATAPVPPDTVAVWSRFSGRLALDIKSVVRGKEWSMSGLAGSVAIEPSLITLEKLEASFSEVSRLAAKMEMRFTGGAMPYRLSGDYELTEFDTGRLFRAIEPTKPPTVEGLFNITGRLAGNGETITRAIDRLQGEFQLTSRQGVFRGLQRSAGKLSMTSKAVELGASVLGSIFGSDKAVKTAEKVAGQAYFVDQLAQSIGEFNYDLLSVRFNRDEFLNMNLEEISLVSPEIRLNGRGAVRYVVGQPLLEQPLNASLSIATRGKVEQLFSRLRLLDGTKDELGYLRAKESVALVGSLAKPDPSAFFTKMATARIADFLDGE